MTTVNQCEGKTGYSFWSTNEYVGLYIDVVRKILNVKYSKVKIRRVNSKS